MNSYELIMKIKEKMNDPEFSARFNNAANVVNNIPGLQQEVIRIAQMKDQKAQNAALDKLPKQAKDAVKEIIYLLNI